MKKIISTLLLLTFSFTSLQAMVDERVTDFYFGNGVWNTRDNATASKDRLELLIRFDLGITEHSSIKLAYNWEVGVASDIFEVFYQLKEEGQSGLDSGIFTTIASLAVKNPLYSKILDIFINTQANNIAYIENLNIKEMLASYKNSINSGHKVILVSHSQGNLFGVRAYDRLDSWQKRYFWQVSVATPASRVAKGGDYITVSDDKVIVPLTLAFGALPANAKNSNTGDDSFLHHGFVETIKS